MGRQVLYAENLPEIPSEYIEPYAQRFMMMRLESVWLGFETPAEAKSKLEAVESFLCCFGGLHAQIAIMNEYSRFRRIPDEELSRIAKRVFDKNIDL